MFCLWTDLSNNILNSFAIFFNDIRCLVIKWYLQMIPLKHHYYTAKNMQVEGRHCSHQTDIRISGIVSVGWKGEYIHISCFASLISFELHCFLRSVNTNIWIFAPPIIDADYTRKNAHSKLLQVCKQVVTSLFTSCVRTACS